MRVRSVGGYGEIGTLTHCCSKCKMVQSLWKAVWQFLKKLNRVTIWLCSSPFRCINKRNENYCSHRNSYTHVYNSILYHNRQKAGTTHKPRTWWADQSNADVMLGIIVEYYLVIKKKGACYNVDEGWTLQSSCCVKEASHKRPPVTVFHWYEMSRIEQSIESEQIRLCWEVGCVWRLGGKWRVTASG